MIVQRLNRSVDNSHPKIEFIQGEIESVSLNKNFPVVVSLATIEHVWRI